MNYNTIIGDTTVSLKSFLRSFPTKHPGIVQDIKDYPGQSNPEKLYNFLHQQTKIPTCVECSSEVTFINFRKGYQRFCGTKCSAICRSRTQPNPASTKKARKKISNSRKDILKYQQQKHTPHPLDNITPPFSDPQTLQTIHTFILDNLNTFVGQIQKRNPKLLSEISTYPGSRYAEQTWNLVNQKTAPRTCKVCGANVTFLDYNRGYNTYCGHKCAGKDTSAQGKQKMLVSWLRNRQQAFSTKYKPLYTIDEYTNVTVPLPYLCLTCGTTFSDHIDDGSDPRCPKCFPKTSPWSNKEKELVAFIESIYSGPIIENTRKVISPQEIDVFLPDKKLGIEFHGMFWHSHLQKENGYHQQKQQAAQEIGVHLIQIWENEWDTKQDLVKSRLASKLGQSQTVIHGRKCTIHPIDTKTKQAFLDQNHIQGNCVSLVNLGLFSQCNLVGVMTFGQSRFNKKAEWELLRFCCEQNTNITGGASKLFQHFLKTHTPKSIISYSDNRWNTGVLYEKLGMKQIGITRPNYWYFKAGQPMYNRFRFQKHLLSKQLTKFDPKLSEFENMSNNNWLRMYDAGNTIFLWEQPI